MPTPAATRPMPQDRGFGPFPDHERERHIADCGRLMGAAMDRYAESSDLADGDAATRSRRASEAVDRKTKETGVNPGTITGLSRKTHARDTDTAWSRSNSGVG